MAELGAVASVVTLIVVANDISNYFRRVCSDWKNAPEIVRECDLQVSTLGLVLRSLEKGIINNHEFVAAFDHGTPSVLLSKLGPQAPPNELKQVLALCHKNLSDLLESLKRIKDSKWDKIKMAVRNLKEEIKSSIEDVRRWSDMLNKLLEIDNSVLLAKTFNVVKEGNEELRLQHQYQEDRAVREWLVTFDYKAQKDDFIARRHAGSGEWLLRDANFKAWMTGEKKTLFCPGGPGAGKTMATAIVVDHLETQYALPSVVGIAYIFCDAGRQQEQSPCKLLANLLQQLLRKQQLLRRQRTVPQSVQDLHTKYGRQSLPCRSELLGELKSIMSDFKRTLIVVDALDELLVKKDRDEFLADLRSLQRANPANLLFTSRPLQNIAKAFDGNSIQFRIRASTDDIVGYLNQKVEELFKELPDCGDNKGLKVEIPKVVSNFVDGIFLLAKLYMDSIASKHNIKAVRRELENLRKPSADSKTKSWDQAYKKIMVRIEHQNEDDRELARQVLGWVLYAKRPLHIRALQHALATEMGSTQFDLENLTKQETIESVCAGLITVDIQTNLVRLYHHTVREFLQQTSRNWLIAESTITDICLTYLSFDNFKSERFSYTYDSYPLYPYAADYWSYHAEITPLNPPVMAFLRDKAKLSTCSKIMTSSGEWYMSSASGILLAMNLGLTKVIPQLIEDGQDLNSSDKVTGRTPLQQAIYKGSEETVKLLLESKLVDANLKGKSGLTPLESAVGLRHEAMVRLLLKSGKADVNRLDRWGGSQLSAAIRAGDEGIVKLLLGSERVDANLRGAQGLTPLECAVEYRWEAMVRLLLDSGKADINFLDKRGDPLLSAVIRGGNEDAARQLLSFKGIDVNRPNMLEQLPLHLAAVKGCLDIAQQLVKRPETILEPKDLRGRTPLDLATAHQHQEIVDLLRASIKRRPEAQRQQSRTGPEARSTSQHRNVATGQQKPTRSANTPLRACDKVASSSSSQTGAVTGLGGQQAAQANSAVRTISSGQQAAVKEGAPAHVHGAREATSGGQQAATKTPPAQAHSATTGKVVTRGPPLLKTNNPFRRQATPDGNSR